ncbi:T9SS type A sorting domain-containing protein [bacterium]|nr:T9SS type A sorting domain-containing protein [bacterium]
MKHGSRVLLVLVFMFSFSTFALGQASVTIQNDPLELEVGDTEVLEAIYMNSDGVEVDTTFSWRVRPGYLGEIEDAVFSAAAPGEGMIIASVGSTSDTVSVTIEDLGDYPALVVQPEEIELTVGESADIVAVYYDETGTLVDTTFSWSLEPDSLGSLDSNLVFTALTEGEGTLTAAIGDLSATLDIQIEADEGGSGDDLSNLFIQPGDTVVSVGDEISFSLWRHVQDSEAVEMEATWFLEGEPVGTIDEDGLLSVTTAGFSLVHAVSDSGDATALIIADNLDGGDPNTITITRSNPSPQGYNVMATVSEGQSWTIGGLPYPLNVLNGGEIYFPNGSLEEDIRLHIDLPGFAHTDDDSVGYGHNIITGIEFQVLVDDEEIHPYTFESPLFVGLIFKRGLIRQMGLDPADLALYFATEQGDSLNLDSLGISNTIVDSVSNRIYANVAHFSSLVVAPTAPVTGISDDPDQLPGSFHLASPWPNPFNASTTVRISLPVRHELQVAVYDILGREVALLGAGVYSAGTHHLTFSGSAFSSGVYFIRAEAGGDWNAVRKVVLIK